MKHWTTQRKVNLFFHIAAFAVPFFISIASSAVFWSLHSGNVLFGLLAVFIVEFIALAAFVLELFHINTQFAFLRNALPVCGAVGLVELLYRQFSMNNDMLITIALVSVSAIVIIVWLFLAMIGIENVVRDTTDISAEEHLLNELYAMRDRQTQALMQQVAHQAELFVTQNKLISCEKQFGFQPVTSSNKVTDVVTSSNKVTDAAVTSSNKVTDVAVTSSNKATDAEAQFILELFASGKTISQIAKSLQTYTPRKHTAFCDKVRSVVGCDNTAAEQLRYKAICSIERTIKTIDDVCPDSAIKEELYMYRDCLKSDLSEEELLRYVSKADAVINAALTIVERSL